MQNFASVRNKHLRGTLIDGLDTSVAAGNVRSTNRFGENQAIVAKLYR